jgi:hypothetical protein
MCATCACGAPRSSASDWIQRISPRGSPGSRPASTCTMTTFSRVAFTDSHREDRSCELQRSSRMDRRVPPVRVKDNDGVQDPRNASEHRRSARASFASLLRPDGLLIEPDFENVGREAKAVRIHLNQSLRRQSVSSPASCPHRLRRFPHCRR